MWWPSWGSEGLDLPMGQTPVEGFVGAGLLQGLPETLGSNPLLPSQPCPAPLPLNAHPCPLRVPTPGECMEGVPQEPSRARIQGRERSAAGWGRGSSDLR